MATRRAAEQWRELIDAWQRSGLTCRRFAAAVGVNPSTLSWWKWKLRVDDQPAFLEVVVDEATEALGFTVDVGAARVHVPHGFHAGELRRLVDALC